MSNRRSTNNDPIFEPLRFRNLTVKNRVFRSSISGRFDDEDGSLTQTRVNWETKFARGGVGAIISSHVPVLMEGRIMTGYATIHQDGSIRDWAALGRAVHAYGCKYILQLSHSGRQMDMPGVHNQHRVSLSATDRPDPLHGFLCRAMSAGEISRVVDAFAQGARRAKEAGLDGVELHAANGYLFTQFLSSGINDRQDHYGGSLRNRARFLVEVIAAVRASVGPDFHLQVKLNSVDHNNVVPWEKKGNTLEDAIEVAKWCEQAGADALHVSTGSLFPHPLNPPGDLSCETLAVTYDTMISSGGDALLNFLCFRYPLLRRIFRWGWLRMTHGRQVEGVTLNEAARIKRAVTIPVLSTGGYQRASVVRSAIAQGQVDAVSIARSLVANNDLVKTWRSGADIPMKPCTYCNKCLFNVPKNPLGCYEESRFATRDDMIAQIMSVYTPRSRIVAPQATGEYVP
ncbi:MAG: NADH:flavin oxidoreductase [Hyphomicrobiaceae bacterium]